MYKFERDIFTLQLFIEFTYILSSNRILIWYLEEDLSWLNEYSIAELKNLADERGLDYKGIAEKPPELVEKIKQKLVSDLSEGKLFIERNLVPPNYHRNTSYLTEIQNFIQFKIEIEKSFLL